MTDTQKQQFDANGCISRCIIKLSEWHRRPITKDDFVVRFFHKYPHWSDKCGLLCVSDIIDICRELDLCRHADMVRDIAVVKNYFDAHITSGVFLLSERDFLGRREKNLHCSLIDPRDNHLVVWSPCHNDTDVERVLDTDLLDTALAHFLVLRLYR